MNRHTKLFLLLALMPFILIPLFTILEIDNSLFLALSILFLLVFIFNYLIRKNIKYKKYFTSPYNIFTAKYHKATSFDIPQDLLIEKVLESIQKNKFNVEHINKEKGEILATTSFTIWSFGENIYIDIKEENGQTKMNFCSATFFQMNSWGKNEENYEKLFEQVEKSLII